jgi:transposase
MKTFAAFLKPLRERLHALAGPAGQLTLVFDAGTSSEKNLESPEPGPGYYVSSLRPSYDLALLAEGAEHLAEVTLSSGTTLRAWRSRRRIAGKERDVVVVFSAQLYEGQLRGLHQRAARVSDELQEMGPHPQGTPEAVQRRIAQICGRQYIRTLVRYEVVSGAQGRVEVRLWSDLAEYRRLQTRYFGLRVLVSNRSEWSTAQIIEAYRGQAKAESAFRNLKDPGMLATRPQFHWTDQKLHVHALMCVTGYLLVGLLWWRARRGTGFAGGPRTLLSELSRIRCCGVIEKTGRAGRPRVRWQWEEKNQTLRELGGFLKALPRLSQDVIYTP